MMHFLRNSSIRNALCLFPALVGAVGVVLFLTLPALPHQAPTDMLYDSWCCNGTRINGDCEPIPAESVRVVPGGYQITLRPGDHHLVTTEHTFTKAQAETRPSTDGQYHACLYPTENTLRCFYAPPPSF